MDAPTENAVNVYVPWDGDSHDNDDVSGDVDNDEEEDEYEYEEYEYEYEYDDDEYGEECEHDADDSQEYSRQSDPDKGKHDAGRGNKDTGLTLVDGKDDTSVKTNNNISTGTISRVLEGRRSVDPTNRKIAPANAAGSNEGDSSSAVSSWEMIDTTEDDGVMDTKSETSSLSSGVIISGIRQLDITGGDDYDAMSARSKRQKTENGDKNQHDDDDDDDNFSWSAVSDVKSVMTMTTAGSILPGGVTGSNTAVTPIENLREIEVDMNVGVFPDDVTVSIAPTLFAKGAVICRFCSVMNRPDRVFCETCGSPLTANPSLNADAEIAARFAREEERQATAADAALAQMLQSEASAAREAVAVEDANLARRLQEEAFASTGEATGAATVRGAALAYHPEAPAAIAAPAQLPTFKPTEDCLNKAERFITDIIAATEECCAGLGVQCLLSARHGCTLAVGSFMTKHQGMSFAAPRNKKIFLGFYLFKKRVFQQDTMEKFNTVRASLHRERAGHSCGIAIWKTPVTAKSQYASGDTFCLCVVSPRKTANQYEPGVDSIFTAADKRYTIRNSEQCLPLLSFPLDMISFVNPASEGNRTVTEIYRRVWKVMRSTIWDHNQNHSPLPPPTVISSTGSVESNHDADDIDDEDLYLCSGENGRNVRVLFDTAERSVLSQAAPKDPPCHTETEAETTRSVSVSSDGNRGKNIQVRVKEEVTNHRDGTQHLTGVVYAKCGSAASFFLTSSVGVEWKIAGRQVCRQNCI